MSGHPREGAPRCLAKLQHQVDAWRGTAGPEELRRGRAALAGRLRGDESAGEDESSTEQDPPPRSPRPADRAVHGHEQAGGGEKVAGRAGEISEYRTDAAGEE